MKYTLGGSGFVNKPKNAPHWRHGLCLLLLSLATTGMTALGFAPLRAQEADDSAPEQLQFRQFQIQPWPTQAGQAHRAYPFGVYRADNLNNLGPEYYGWSHLPPNQPWRGGSTNTPSRQRYGLDNKTAEEESSVDE